MPDFFQSGLEQSGLEPFLGLLRCPACGAGLQPGRKVLHCRSGHTFDIARQGYASLLTGTRATSGDDADMVRARSEFLSGGSYDPIRQAAVRLAATGINDGSRTRPTTVLDVGCGTGYYLAGVLDHLSGAFGLGLDSSVRALRSAARAHPRAAAARWDTFRSFPFTDRSFDVVLDVFAPRNPAEFHRVLRPAGRLIVVRPTARHLSELRDQTHTMTTIDPAKEERLRQALGSYFEPWATEEVEYVAHLSRREALALVQMTPQRLDPGRSGPKNQEAVPDHVTVSTLVTAYRPL